MSCNQLTTSTGNFSSKALTKFKTNYVIHPDNIGSLVQKSVILISVKKNHTIWLAFRKFKTVANHIVKVYLEAGKIYRTFNLQIFAKVFDGPDSASPLLLSHSGSTKPSSVRSSSHDMYVEFPSYYDPSFGIDVFYTSVR